VELARRGRHAGRRRPQDHLHTELAGRQVRASEDEPQYLVRSEKGGGEAVHKPDALKRR
jgi:hypothetical protein